MARSKSKITVAGRTYTIVTADFETYYDKDYSLGSKAYNTSGYVRDEQFKAHGLGIKIGTGRTRWVPTNQIREVVDAIDWSTAALLCHNTAFDGLILEHHYGVKPAFYLDTLSMSRGAEGHNLSHKLDDAAKRHGLAGKVRRSALDDTKGKRDLTRAESRALGAYCRDDVNDTFKLFWILHDHIPDDELRLIHMTVRMFAQPVLCVDIPRVTAELAKEIKSKASALEKSGASVDTLMSADKFAQALRDAGADPPTKISPTTGKETFAFAKTDWGFQNLLETGSKKVRALCEARLKVRSTIGETRAGRFLEAGKDGARLPMGLLYCGAHTTRWSGSNKMNVQNLLKGGELRRSIRAPKGHQVVVADSQQIEARVVAWAAGERETVAAFARGDDVYKLMASRIYGIPPGRVTKDQRFLGKVCVLALSYGMGANKLQETLRGGALGATPVIMSLPECQNIVTLYRSTNPRLMAYWKAAGKIIDAMVMGQEGTLGPITYGKGYIRLPNGLFLLYPELQGNWVENDWGARFEDVTYASKGGRTKLYSGLLVENITQALARTIIGEQMLAIDQPLNRVVTMSHDEIVTVTPTRRAERSFNEMVAIMSTPPSWAPGLPLGAEGGWAENYSK